ncbi:MAG: hypothetical protein K2H91_00315 [Lachnospiraceae bacterium]|nr:hypothetical protein [Lachnospiraceae bacterium]
MKKRMLALFLGGVMAAGSLAMQMSSTAWAITRNDCGYYSEPHIKNFTITAGDGQLTVAVDLEYENSNSSGVNIYLFEKELVKETLSEYSDTMTYPVYREYAAEGYQDDLYAFMLLGGTYTFTGLTNGKTYYVYAEAIDWHDMEPGEDDASHYAAYLGSYTPTAKDASASSAVPAPVPVPETSTVTVPNTVINTVTTDTDSIKAVAAEVLKGKWGVGRERKIKLEAAGYDYAAVQKMVARLMK